MLLPRLVGIVMLYAVYLGILLEKIRWPFQWLWSLGQGKIDAHIGGDVSSAYISQSTRLLTLATLT